ncbi:Bud site selection protein RAX2 [Smittium culicis]|uniref:Bud site selection protein RAX2 n=1 Tax=Smittium culicis TaxID=133412 RepID=A0A1R1XYB6_9FUNG|nr:Bud site selection protein RAX2 [Smittium culicis]
MLSTMNHQLYPPYLSLFLFLSLLSHFTLPQTSPNTQLKINDLNQAVVFGSFDGISSNVPPQNINPLTSKAAQFAGNQATPLDIETLENESISAGCTINYFGTDWYVFAGFFSSINNQPASNVFAINSQGKTNNFSGGVNGPVNSLYCDSANSIVWLGGNFTKPKAAFASSSISSLSDYQGKLLAYDFSKDLWKSSPWRGLDGDVLSLAPNKDSSIIWVGGIFNNTVDDSNSFSINTQPVNLASAGIAGGNSFLTAPFNNPYNAICTDPKSNSTIPWLMRDLMPGFFDISFVYPITPTLLRIKNAQQDGRGTKSIRVQTHQNDTAIQLSYIDPVSKLQQFCTNECPLVQSSSVWQEFSFTVPTEVTGIKINIASYYGQGGGFEQVEVYQRDAVVYGNPKLNFPPCSTTSLSNEINTTGQWVILGSDATNTQFIKTDIDPKSNSNGISNSITAFPYISDSGFYDVYFDIPSCTLINDCRNRVSASVQLTVTAGSSGVLNATINQNVSDNTAVLLYSGYIPKSTAEFRSSVKLSFDPDTAANSQQSTLTLVFERVRFIRRKSFTGLNGIFGIRADSTLVSLVQPSYGTTKSPLPDSSIVRSISSYDDGMIFAGTFNSTSKNIILYQDGKLLPLPNGGLNGDVYSTLYTNSTLYAGGMFTSTNDNSIRSSNIISLSFKNSTADSDFSPIDGISGNVNVLSTYSPLNNTIIIGGLFSSSNISNPSSSQGVALYNETSSLFVSPPLLGNGPTVAYSHNDYSILAGQFTSVAAISASGIARIRPNSELAGVGSYNGNLVPNKDGILQINAVTLQTIDNEPPILVAGGIFNTKSGSSNVAYLQDNSFQSLDNAVDGEVLSLVSAGTYLFIGGKKNTNPGGFSGISIWDMKKKAFERSLPQLSTSSSNPVQDTFVSSFAIRPGSSTVIAGGNFDKAGSITCSSICTWDINELRWSPLSSQPLDGVVNSLMIVNNNLYIGGQFVNGTSSSSVLVYNFNSDTFAPLSLSGTNLNPKAKTKRDLSTPLSFPGTVRQIAQTGTSPFYFLGDDSSSSSSFIYSSSESTGFLKLDDFNPSSKINSISVFGLNPTSNSSPPSTSNYTVVALGNLILSSGATASSAALLNGSWVPYLYAVNSNGSPGIINSISSLAEPTHVNQRNRMKLLWVVLIALAISLFIVFLTVLAGLIYIYYKNRGESTAINSSTRSVPLALGAEKKTFGHAPGAGVAYGNVSPALMADKSPQLSNDGSRYSSHLSTSSHSVTSPFILPTRPSTSNQKEAENFLNLAPLESQPRTSQIIRPETHAPNITYAMPIAPVTNQRETNNDLSFDNVSPKSSFESDSEFYKPKAKQSLFVKDGGNRTISKSPVPFFNMPSENTKVDNNLVNKPDNHEFLKNTNQHAPAPYNEISNASEATKYIPAGLPQDKKDSIIQNIGRDQTSIRNSLKIYPMYYAKFTFSSRENGELGFIAGDRVFVIDKSDEIWWMGIVDPGRGLPLEQGLFPATYVSSEPPSPTDYSH